jgi:hypothetical protein
LHFPLPCPNISRANSGFVPAICYKVNIIFSSSDPTKNCLELVARIMLPSTT